MKDTALRVAGVIFMFVAIMHLLRVMFKVQLILGGHYVRLLFSLIGFAAAFLLAIWMFAAAGKK